MGMAVGPKTSVKSQPNVVPMIDIMLVLLIIFMIVTPVISAGFQAQMPLAKNAEARPDEPDDMILGIDNEGTYYLQQGTGKIQIVGQGQLESLLRQVYENPARRDKILYFKGDKDLEFGKIQDAIEIARRAGVRVLAAITEQKKEPGSSGFFGNR